MLDLTFNQNKKLYQIDLVVYGEKKLTPILKERFTGLERNSSNSYHYSYQGAFVSSRVLYSYPESKTATNIREPGMRRYTEIQVEIYDMEEWKKYN